MDWREAESGVLGAVWELSDSGFRGTAGGDFPTAAPGSTETTPSNVPCRGGGTGFLSTLFLAELLVKPEMGIQSGSLSMENGLDLRSVLGTNPSLVGCTRAFTGLPGAFVSCARIQTSGPLTIIKPPPVSIRARWRETRCNRIICHAILIVQVQKMN